MELVERSPSKRDPAWEHCEKLSEGGKFQLKCNYCDKIFKGGGIYRIKEHLAGLKGNGVTCLKVQPDIRRQMLDCLNGASGKKRKMEQLGVDSSDNPGTNVVEVPINQICSSSTDFELFTVNELTENDYNDGDARREDVVNNKSGSRRKLRARVGREADVFVSGATILAREPVAGTRPKRDPAWNHCKIFKNGGKTQLKCIYCGKVFKGGGIYRLKEHLAGQKGNSVTCFKVNNDVRSQMYESLSAVSGIKSNKPKLLNWKKSSYDNPPAKDVELLNNGNNLNSEFDMLPLNEIHQHDSNACIGTKDAIVLTGPQPSNSKVEICDVHMAIGRFFFDVGLSMDAVDSAYFQPMIQAVASQGPGAVGPSYHDLRSWILKNSVDEVGNDVEQVRLSWEKTGCSILVNEWKSEKGKMVVNFLAYCPQGTVFLRSVDISNAIDSVDVLYKLIGETLGEVGVGNVLQVITSSENKYVIAGKRMMETYPSIFWTPCAGHSINLMIFDIGELPWVKIIIDQAKSITRYMYSNSIVLNMMRRYTSGVDLIDFGITRSSSDFLTLKRMVKMSHNLYLMVTSKEWMEGPYSKTSEGLAVLDYISDKSFWSTCELITRLTDPLLRLLRIVCSGKGPGMGYVYAGMYRAKETIKNEIVNVKEYGPYWNIIDHHWEQLQWHPLHAAGFYFNPKFFYSLEGDARYHLRSLVNDCIEKIVPEPHIQDKILKETACYHNEVGEFGRKMAVRGRDTLLPIEWWLTFSGACPNLSRLATRILSQTCSRIQHNKTSSNIHLELMHESENILEHQRISDLVFVQYNLSLKQRSVVDKKPQAVDPISCENVDIVGDWVAMKKVCLDDLQSDAWRNIDPPLENVMPSDAPVDDIEALAAGFDDSEILNGINVDKELLHRKEADEMG